MPNYGFYEWIVILTVLGLIWGIVYMFLPGALKRDIRKLRQMWHDTAPRDNTHDRP